MAVKANRNKQWLSLVTPPFVQTSDDEEETDESASDNETDEEEVESLGAFQPAKADSGLSKANGVNSLALDKKSPTTNVVSSSPSARTPMNKGSNQSTMIPINNQSPSMNPLLSGQTNTEAFAKLALEGMPDEEQGDDAAMSKGLASLRDVRLSPEEKLQNALKYTNPTPRSIWKRLAIGAVEGASQVNAQDSGASALGKILGGAGAQAVPQVDQARQQEQIKKKAIDQYQLDKATEDARLKREKQTADLKLDREKFEAARADKRQAMLDKVETSKRLAASRELGILEKLPNEAKEERAKKAQQIKEKYDIDVPASYGQDKESSKEYKRFDEELNAFIKVDSKGAPVLDDNGDKIITQQGRAASTKGSITKEEAESRVAPINPGALRNQAFNEARKLFSKDGTKKTDISRLSDQEILADPEYGAWVRARQQDLLGEAKNNREQEINRVIASGQNIPPGKIETGTGSNLRVPSKSESKSKAEGSSTKPQTKNTKFDARNPFDLNKYRR